jgi:hypothetical protein
MDFVMSDAVGVGGGVSEVQVGAQIRSQWQQQWRYLWQVGCLLFSWLLVMCAGHIFLCSLLRHACAYLRHCIDLSCFFLRYVPSFFNHCRQREDVQAAAKLVNFPATDMTTALITVKRCMYAQLMGADFAPPKAYPAALASAHSRPCIDLFLLLYALCGKTTAGSGKTYRQQQSLSTSPQPT